MGDDDDRRDGRARNRDFGCARGAAANTRTVLMVPVVCGSWCLVGALSGDDTCAVPMVLGSSGLRGHRPLVRGAKPECAGFPNCERDPESDEGRTKPEPAGLTH